MGTGRARLARLLVVLRRKYRKVRWMVSNGKDGAAGAELNKAGCSPGRDAQSGPERTNGAFMAGSGTRTSQLYGQLSFQYSLQRPCGLPGPGGWPGTAGVETHLLHCSGEERPMGTLLPPVSKPDAHGYGSAITYARRYALQSIACVGETTTTTVTGPWVIVQGPVQAGTLQVQVQAPPPSPTTNGAGQSSRRQPTC